MFVCGPKYFSECLKLERVYKNYALRMANELEKSNTKCSITTHNSVNVFPTEIIIVYK